MTSARFDKPWMDELDGHNCVKRAATFGVKGAVIGKYKILRLNLTLRLAS